MTTSSLRDRVGRAWNPAGDDLYTLGPDPDGHKPVTWLRNDIDGRTWDQFPDPNSPARSAA